MFEKRTSDDYEDLFKRRILKNPSCVQIKLKDLYKQLEIYIQSKLKQRAVQNKIIIEYK